MMTITPRWSFLSKLRAKSFAPEPGIRTFCCHFPDLTYEMRYSDCKTNFVLYGIKSSKKQWTRGMTGIIVSKYSVQFAIITLLYMKTPVLPRLLPIHLP